MKTLNTEVLIIGSGFGAAPPALHFCERGYDVLLIEKGDNINPESDFKQTMDPKYLLKYIKCSERRRDSIYFCRRIGRGFRFL